MKYQFILSYKATDSETVMTNTCHPVYGDDLSVTIDREDGEWYYKRKLDGKITFVRSDYNWIMAQPFDGTFILTIEDSTDGGNTWHPYFEGTFSRANLEIDEDNQSASLSSFIEGVYNAIENGKNDDYDLMKIIPDGDAKTVQGQVHPALAMVDYQNSITQSDIFCNTPIVASGYKSGISTGWDYNKRVPIVSDNWRLMGIYAEVVIETEENNTKKRYLYAGNVDYAIKYSDYDNAFTSLEGTLVGPGVDNYFKITFQPVDNGGQIYDIVSLGYWKKQWNQPEYMINLIESGVNTMSFIYSPLSLDGIGLSNPIKKVYIRFHYIRATLLTQSGGDGDSVLDFGKYYKRMEWFKNGGLTIYPSTRTVEQPNGHRLLPGTGEKGTIPQYFAPPDNNHNYIPLAEYNWVYCSLWYTIEPSVANGLLNPDKIGSFRWSRCWPIGTVLRYLLDRITDGKVVFTEDSTASRFLYDAVNPVAGHEPFDYLITQKSNVMNPGGGDAQRCPVRLQWFLELLRNAFNCYYWLEKQNDGRYLFRVEHVEYCRKGGRYDGDLDHSIDITTLKPRRNFIRGNQFAKTYADQTNKYAYNMQNLMEKYTFSWQGDGGSNAFKGNPMFFKAGWIEKSSSESHEVDNIFADLAWLMLNAGSDTASSKNYDGVFLFSGYKTHDFYTDGRPLENLSITDAGSPVTILSGITGCNLSVCFAVNNRTPITVSLVDITISTTIESQSFIGTGKSQCAYINRRDLDASHTYFINIFIPDGHGTIHLLRIHDYSQNINVYNVPNTTDMLNPSNYLQNGPLAWPWLQNEYLPYDIPAQKWSYDSDDIGTATFISGGTVKMIQKQAVKPVPIADTTTEDNIMSITGIRTSIEGGKTGIITNAKINLSSRNAELTIVYDPIPPQE